MPIITKSYFDTAERNIPNTNYAEVSSRIDSLIAVREKEYLLAVFGYEMYVLLIADLVTPATRFANIINGVEFTALDGRLKKWEGLINVSTLQSPIADYVYYWYLRDSVNNMTGPGMVQAMMENATPVSSVKQQARVYNNMVDKTILLIEFLRANYTVYPEWQLHSGTYQVSRFMQKINAFNF